jgi:hypothetical protein
VVLVALIATAAVLFAASPTSPATADGLPLGAGTATVTWAAGTGTGFTTSYRGTVAGIALTGTGGLSPAFQASIENSIRDPKAAVPDELPVFTFTGTLGGTPYTVNLSFITHGHLATSSSALETLQVTGTFGTHAITGTAGSTNAANAPLIIHATIGSLQVAATVPSPMSKTRMANATFVVTR